MSNEAFRLQLETTTAKQNPVTGQSKNTGTAPPSSDEARPMTLMGEAASNKGLPLPNSTVVAKMMNVYRGRPPSTSRSQTSLPRQLR